MNTTTDTQNRKLISNTGSQKDSQNNLVETEWGHAEALNSTTAAIMHTHTTFS